MMELRRNLSHRQTCWDGNNHGGQDRTAFDRVTVASLVFWIVSQCCCSFRQVWLKWSVRTAGALPSSCCSCCRFGIYKKTSLYDSFEWTAPYTPGVTSTNPGVHVLVPRTHRRLPVDQPKAGGSSDPGTGQIRRARPAAGQRGCPSGIMESVLRINRILHRVQRGYDPFLQQDKG